MKRNIRNSPATKANQIDTLFMKYEQGTKIITVKQQANSRSFGGYFGHTAHWRSSYSRSN